MQKINIIGGGLAGVEAALCLSRYGLKVNLFDMKPEKFSEVHKNENLSEIVCSNSFGNMSISTSSGLLKKEMEILDSEVVKTAYSVKVDAGGALAVDREKFSYEMTQKVKKDNNINIVRRVVEKLDNENIWIVACGPLCDNSLTDYLQKEVFDNKFLNFFDAIAPIVYTDSIDTSKGFWGSRYSDDKDYFNCILNEDEYNEFYENLISAEKVKVKEFEQNYFEACLPIEEIAKRGKQTLLFGPLKPVGLEYNSKRPFAVVQLRKENREGSLLSLVGFQTKLTYKEQKRVFSLIPALKNAEFAKLGSLHKNTFIDSPKLLNHFLQLKNRQNIFFAGQITGVEGYMASAATGIFAGMNIALLVKGKNMMNLPKNTMLNGLVEYITTKEGEFQPMSENFGLVEPIKMKNKKLRREKQAEIAIEHMKKWREDYESIIT